MRARGSVDPKQGVHRPISWVFGRSGHARQSKSQSMKHLHGRGSRRRRRWRHATISWLGALRLWICFLFSLVLFWDQKGSVGIRPCLSVRLWLSVWAVLVYIWGFRVLGQRHSRFRTWAKGLDAAEKQFT